MDILPTSFPMPIQHTMWDARKWLERTEAVKRLCNGLAGMTTICLYTLYLLYTCIYYQYWLIPVLMACYTNHICY